MISAVADPRGFQVQVVGGTPEKMKIPAFARTKSGYFEIMLETNDLELIRSVLKKETNRIEIELIIEKG